MFKIASGMDQIYLEYLDVIGTKYARELVLR